MTFTALFDSVEQLAKFYKVTSGVDFVGDAYKWLGSYCVKFNLGIQTEEIAQDKIWKAGGTMVKDFQ